MVGSISQSAVHLQSQRRHRQQEVPLPKLELPPEKGRGQLDAIGGLFPLKNRMPHLEALLRICFLCGESLKQRQIF